MPWDRWCLRDPPPPGAGCNTRQQSPEGVCGGCPSKFSAMIRPACVAGTAAKSAPLSARPVTHHHLLPRLLVWPSGPTAGAFARGKATGHALFMVRIICESGACLTRTASVVLYPADILYHNRDTVTGGHALRRPAPRSHLRPAGRFSAGSREIPNLKGLFRVFWHPTASAGKGCCGISVRYPRGSGR
jgi:hypothetical protein